MVLIYIFVWIDVISATLQDREGLLHLSASWVVVLVRGILILRLRLCVSERLRSSFETWQKNI